MVIIYVTNTDKITLIGEDHTPNCNNKFIFKRFVVRELSVACIAPKLLPFIWYNVKINSLCCTINLFTIFGASLSKHPHVAGRCLLNISALSALLLARRIISIRIYFAFLLLQVF